MRALTVFVIICFLWSTQVGVNDVSAEQMSPIIFPIQDSHKKRQFIQINIIHPQTKEIVHSFSPEAYEIEMDIMLFKEKVEKWVADFAQQYNKMMVLDRIDMDGQLIKGKPTITIDEEALIEAVLHDSFNGGDVLLPLIITESGYKPEDLPHFNEVILSTYTTYFRPYQVGRSKNIELSSTSIHNVIVGNRDIFSFNTMVGPRDVAAGYQEAPEILRGQVIMGVGGGICQTSSTLFNAVDRLGVEILERHHHSKDVGYVPKGRDATVSFGGLDFQFQNTTGIPFLMKSYYGNGTLTVEIRTTKEYADLFNNELANDGRD